MIKKIISLMLCISLIFTLGCTSEKQENDLNTIRIGVMPDMVSVPFIIGENEKLFKKHGIDLEITVFKSASDRDAALQAGVLDAVSADYLAAYFYMQGGLDLKITSATDIECMIVSNEKSDIYKPQDLSGKTVGISYNTIMEYFVDAVSGEDISFEKASVPAIPIRMEMLNAGEIDVAALPEPLGTSSILTGSVKVISSSDIGVNFGALLFRQTFISENEELVKNFYKGLNEAYGLMSEEILIKYKDELIDKLLFPANVFENISFKRFEKAALPKEKDLKKAEDWLIRKGLVEKTFEYNDMVFRVY